MRVCLNSIFSFFLKHEKVSASISKKDMWTYNKAETFETSEQQARGPQIKVGLTYDSMNNAFYVDIIKGVNLKDPCLKLTEPMGNTLKTNSNQLVNDDESYFRYIC